ncbi:Os02g0136966, partial [Oryza sativa Japonica Group]
MSSRGNVTYRMFLHSGEKHSFGVNAGNAARAGEGGGAAISFSSLCSSVMSLAPQVTRCSWSEISESGRGMAERRKPRRPIAQRCLASKGSRRRQERYSGEASNIQRTLGLLEVSQMQSSEGPWMEARSQPEAW